MTLDTPGVRVVVAAFVAPISLFPGQRAIGLHQSRALVARYMTLCKL